MNTAYVILAIIIVLFTITITIKIDFNFNVLQNIGNVKVKIFKYITIFNSNISVIGDYLNFSNKKSKIITVKLDINDINIQFASELSSYLRKKILPLYLLSNITICLENPHYSSLISGLLKTLTTIYAIKLRQNNSDIKIENSIETGFRHNIIIIDLKFKFVITIYDLLWSILRTMLIIRRVENVKEEESTFNQQ